MNHIPFSFSRKLVSIYNASTKTDVTNNSITYQYDTADSLMQDVAGNIRYYGATPNNYIYFNCSDYANQSSSTCELWRIIGVFDGKIKLIRNESIGSYSWDNKDTTTGAENNSGKNDWTDARLMKLLNPGYDSETVGGSLYYNAKSGTCYNGLNNATKDCAFTSIGIKNITTKDLISDTIYYLGSYYNNSIPVDEIYKYEKENNVYTGRPTSWQGKIALPYPSDYGYAVDLSKCKANLNMSEYGNNTACVAANWMKIIVNNGWLLTSTTSSYLNWHIQFGNAYSDEAVYASKGIVPVLYLNSELNIKAGTGSSSEPYQLLVS